MQDVVRWANGVRGVRPPHFRGYKGVGSVFGEEGDGYILDLSRLSTAYVSLYGQALREIV